MQTIIHYVTPLLQYAGRNCKFNLTEIRRSIRRKILYKSPMGISDFKFFWG